MLDLNCRSRYESREDAYCLPVFPFSDLACVLPFFGLRMRGLENVPLSGRLLVAPNHIAVYDPPIIGTCLPRECYFAAKNQLFKGWLAKFFLYVNAIPVRRTGSDKEAIKKLSALLREEKAVMIFPEGTRADDPEKGLDPKSGVGLLAVRNKADILPGSYLRNQ